MKFRTSDRVFATLFIVGILGALVSLAGCAGQRMPEGGPIDTTSPEIISVYPAPNTINYSDTRIAFEFDKYVDRRSVEESIFISPYVKNIEFDWSAREVELNFQDPLKKNTTYVVTVGTDVVDINNHNRMAHAVSLAFSTGAEIDRGEIRGRVFDEKPGGVMIFSYRLDGILVDTLNPLTQKPDYITQTGANGEYSLSHLSFGNYRVMALRDEFRNLLYDPETDAMSMAPADIHLDNVDSLRSGIDFQLGTEDTTAPRLVTAFATDARHVELKFSEYLDSSSLSLSSFTVADTGGEKRLRVEDYFLHRENPEKVTLVTDPQDRSGVYKVSAVKLRDRTGHTINPLAMSKRFDGSDRPDTLAPVILFATLMDSTQLFSPADQFVFDLDDAVRRPSVEHAVRLRGADSTDISLAFSWISSASFTVVPRQPLRENSSYSITIRLDSLRDAAGNHWKDSTRGFPLHTIDPERLSSIEGILIDNDTSLVDRYLIVAENTTEKLKKPVRVAARRGAKFILPDLTPGEYRLRAFQDLLGSGVFSPGRPFPFIPAERFAVTRDSIKVRARWPIEGEVVRFR